MNIRHRLSMASAALVIAFAGIVGCSSSDDDETVVTVGTVRGLPHFYAPYLYEEHAADGLRFEIVTLDSTPALNDALLSGSVDFAITGVTPVMAAGTQGRELKIIASAADGGMGFVGSEGMTSIDDVRGQRVGYIQAGAPEVALRLLLESNGITEDEVELVPVPIPDLANAFANGSVDSFLGVELAVSVAKANGGVDIADPYDTAIGRVNLGFATTDSLIEEDPELVQAVVDTHVDTIAWMNDNVEEWLSEMVEAFGGDEEILASAIDNFWLRADLSEEYLQQLQTLAEYMEELGMAETVPQPSEYLDTQFAPEG